eukprot:Nk52_evm13s2309 gene=Nk52_evmTU13s2309
MNKIAILEKINVSLHSRIRAEPFCDPSKPSSNTLSPHEKQFWEFCELLHDVLCHFIPELANILGDYRILDVVTMTSTSAQTREFTRVLGALRAELENMEPALKGARKEVLLWFQEVSALIDFFYEDFQTHFFRINHLNGCIAAVMGQMLAFHPLSSAEHCEALITRSYGLAEYRRKGAKKSSEHMYNMLPETFPLVKQSRASFEKQNVSQEPLICAVKEYVLPSIGEFCDFMKNEYIPKLGYLNCVTETEESSGEMKSPPLPSAGLCAQPGGREEYEKRLIRQAGAGELGLNADDIHSLGFSEIERISMEMRKVLQYVPESLQNLDELISKFPNFEDFPELYPCVSEGDLIAQFQDCLDRVNKVVPEYFSVIPKQKMEIECVRSFMRDSAPQAFYRPGTHETPGKFMINCGSDPSQYSTDTCMTLAVHEGIPGHHFQIALQKEIVNVPKVLQWNIASSNVFVEGWALYTEFLAEEMGMYPGHEDGNFSSKIEAFSYFGRLSNEMPRAVRLVVDTGLHAKGWSREKAIAFVQRYVPKQSEEIAAEVERYMVCPAQACGYKLGEQRIRALRKRAEERIGKENFDIKAFHGEVIGYGTVTLKTLERLIEEWIEKCTRSSTVL